MLAQVPLVSFAFEPPKLLVVAPPEADEAPLLPGLGVVADEQATPAYAKTQAIRTTLLLLILGSSSRFRSSHATPAGAPVPVLSFASAVNKR